MDVKALPFDTEKVSLCLDLLKTLNHGKRQAILSLIYTGEAVTVTSIYKRLKLKNQVEVSLEMRFLREKGLVKGQRVRHEVFYAIVPERFQQVNKMMEAIQ